jgi:hypothetical protein
MCGIHKYKPMNWHDRFKAMKTGLGLTNSDIADNGLPNRCYVLGAIKLFYNYWSYATWRIESAHLVQGRIRSHSLDME